MEKDFPELEKMLIKEKKDKNKVNDTLSKIVKKVYTNEEIMEIAKGKNLKIPE